MSTYGVNKLLYRLENDVGLRERFHADPREAMAGFSLSPEETEALLQGDVKTLYLRGAHPFLLSFLPRHGLSGLDNPTYFERLRGLGPPPPSQSVRARSG